MSYLNDSLAYGFNLRKLNTESLTDDEIFYYTSFFFFDTLSFEFRNILDNCDFRGF